VRLQVWNKQKPAETDTFHFSNIRYDQLLTRTVNQTYTGDSLSISFESMQSKGFNFCYTTALKNRAGNYADRWFCKE